MLSAREAARHPLFDLVDEIEVANGANTERESAFALEVASELGFRGTGGSDAHSVHGLGKAVTVFDNGIDSEEDLIEAIAYVIAWLAFPVAMLMVARMLDREKRFIRFIVVYNWAAVLQNALYLPIPMMGMTGLISVNAANGMGMMALLLILGYTWFITKTALEVTSAAAAGIVALDLGLSIFISSFSNSLL